MTNRYKIRQNLISIGDDFWIENEAGQKVFKVDGKVLRIRKTLVFEDAKGKEACPDPGTSADHQRHHGGGRCRRQGPGYDQKATVHPAA